MYWIKPQILAIAKVWGFLLAKPIFSLLHEIEKKLQQIVTVSCNYSPVQ